LVSLSERDGSVGPPDINGPDFSFGLKAEGKMMRILPENLVLLGRQLLHFNRESAKSFQKRDVATD